MHLSADSHALLAVATPPKSTLAAATPQPQQQSLVLSIGAARPRLRMPGLVRNLPGSSGVSKPAAGLAMFDVCSQQGPFGIRWSAVAMTWHVGALVSVHCQVYTMMRLPFRLADYQGSYVRKLSLAEHQLLHRLSFGHRNQRSYLIILYQPNSQACQDFEAEVSTGLVFNRCR